MKNGKERKMKNRNYILLAILFAIACSTASAIPSWCGEDRTTHQAWSFNDANTNPAPNPGWNNPYGTPNLWVDSHHDWMRHPVGEDGYWALSGEVDIAIPNVKGGEYKDFEIYLRWKPYGGEIMSGQGNIIPKPGLPADLLFAITPWDKIEMERFDDPENEGWISTVITGRMWPNPDFE